MLRKIVSRVSTNGKNEPLTGFELVRGRLYTSLRFVGTFMSVRIAIMLEAHQEWKKSRTKGAHVSLLSLDCFHKWCNCNLIFGVNCREGWLHHIPHEFVNP